MAGIVNTKIKRPDKKIIQRFMKVPTTVASDCMNRMNSMYAEIKPLIRGLKIAGPAITVQCISGSNIMNHKAIYLAKPGDVIVIDARGEKNTAVWGFVQTFACIQKKIAAVIIDGSIRDVAEIRKSRFPIFCAGVSPAGPHKGWPDNINVPIACAGAPVHPGDIIIGDDDGVVVVPLEQAEKIILEAKKRMEMEENWFKKMKKGKSSLEAIGLDKKLSQMDVIYSSKDIA